jgi:Protein of unknown function (DUF3365)
VTSSIKAPLWAAVILAAIGAAVGADDGERYLQDSREVATTLAQQLGAALKKELEANGPASAIKVCKNLGPNIAAELSNQHGWRVSRVSLKVRNPLLGTPDAWEQKALADFDARAAGGDAADKLEFSEIVTEPQGRYFRYVKAIPVQAMCLACHGAPDAVPQEVKAMLSEQYPNDKALGYGVGQIRGAISIKRPL